MGSPSRIERGIIRWIVAVLLILVQHATGTVLPGPMDVVLIVDSSGNLTDAAYALEKTALIGALRDSLNVPIAGDAAGAMSLTVLQFGQDTKVRIEAEAVVVDSVDKLNTVIRAIETMPRMFGPTYPAGGLAGANTILSGDPRYGRARARAWARQSFCLITGGELTSPGPSVQEFDVVKFSRYNESYRLDLFSALVVDDGVLWEAEDYSNLAFGGGALEVVSTAADLSRAIGRYCFFQEEITMKALEVTQVVQDLDNGVRLVEGKKTLVRAYLGPTALDRSVIFRSRLRYRVAGESRWDWAVATTRDGFGLASTGSFEHRGDLEATLNFLLPIKAGDLELQLWPLAKMTCDEVDSSVCTTSITFDPAPTIPVTFVAIKYTVSEHVFQLTYGQIVELRNRLLSIYPVAGIKFDLRQLDLGETRPRFDLGGTEVLGTPVAPSAEDVNRKLDSIRVLECPNVDGCPYLFYYGAMPGNFYPERSGLTSTTFQRTSCGVFEGGNGWDRHVQAHEMGHGLGFVHPNSPTSDFCRKVPPDDFEDSQYIFSTVAGVDDVATIGPLDEGVEKTIYGWDSMQNLVVDPSNHFELMSYCERDNNFNWISSKTYERAYDELDSRRRELQGSNDANVCLYRAKIDTEAQSIDFLPVLPVGNAAVSEGIAGDYTLTFRDSLGNILEAIAFNTDFVEGDIRRVDIQDPQIYVPSSMFVTAACQETALTACVSELTEIGCLVRSPNTPSVRVTFPNGGETLSGRTEFTWVADDLDGNESMTFLVEFSPDNGGTWKSLAIDRVEMSMNVDIGDLGGASEQALLRVQVSDGFNTAFDTSDATFVVSNSPPRLAILSPTEGQRFAGEQLVLCDVVPFDLEDEELGVDWYSDVDGFLGTGSDLYLVASQLREGMHTIEARTKDTSGAIAIENVSIVVQSPFATPVPETTTTAEAASTSTEALETTSATTTTQTETSSRVTTPAESTSTSTKATTTALERTSTTTTKTETTSTIAETTSTSTKATTTAPERTSTTTTKTETTSTIAETTSTSMKATATDPETTSTATTETETTSRVIIPPSKEDQRCNPTFCQACYSICGEPPYDNHDSTGKPNSCIADPMCEVCEVVCQVDGNGNCPVGCPSGDLECANDTAPDRRLENGPMDPQEPESGRMNIEFWKMHATT